MKKFLGFAALTAATFSSFWYYQGVQSKSFIEKSLNEAKIGFEKISLSGFPLQYMITVEKPSFVSEDVEALAERTLEFTSNLLGNRFSAKQKGRVVLNLIYLETISLDGQNDISLQVDKGSILHPFEALPIKYVGGNLSINFDHVESISLSGKNLQFKNTLLLETNLIEIGHLSLAWSKRSQGKSDEHQLSFGIQDLKSTQNINNPFEMLPKTGALEFDGTFTLPKGGFDMIELPPISWNIKKFHINTELGETTLQSSFSLEDMTEELKSIHFNLASDSTFTEKGYKESIEQTLSSLKNLDGMDKETKRVATIIRDNFDVFVQLMPKSYELSPVATHLDLHALLNIKNDDASLEINHVDFRAKPYSLISGGHFEISSKGPDGMYTIDITNYKKLIRDAFQWANSISKFNALIHPEAQESLFTITPEMVDKLLVELKRISSDPQGDSADLKLKVQVKADGSMTIGTHSLLDTLEKIGAILTPEPKK